MTCLWCDGIRMAGTRDCHTAPETVHGKLLAPSTGLGVANENETKECD